VLGECLPQCRCVHDRTQKWLLRFSQSGGRGGSNGEENISYPCQYMLPCRSSCRASFTCPNVIVSMKSELNVHYIALITHLQDLILTFSDRVI
jgi:hypothetical protein